MTILATHEEAAVAGIADRKRVVIPTAGRGARLTVLRRLEVETASQAAPLSDSRCVGQAQGSS